MDGSIATNNYSGDDIRLINPGVILSMSERELNISPNGFYRFSSQKLSKMCEQR